jgi:hypothetical protein
MLEFLGDREDESTAVERSKIMGRRKTDVI